MLGLRFRVLPLGIVQGVGNHYPNDGDSKKDHRRLGLYRLIGLALNKPKNLLGTGGVEKKTEATVRLWVQAEGEIKF